LLNYACQAQITLPTAESLLNSEITWLKKVRVSFSVYVTDRAAAKILKLCLLFRAVMLLENFVNIDRICTELWHCYYRRCLVLFAFSSLKSIGGH